MATAQNNTNGGRQLTIQVMRSYISLASTGRETPEPEEEEELLECGAFRRSVSETPSPPLSPLPPQQETGLPPMENLNELLDRMLNTRPEDLSEEERAKAIAIGDRLKKLGDSMDSKMEGHGDLLLGLMNPDESVQETIKRTIRGLKNRVNAKTVVKVFSLGLRLLLCTPPSMEYEYKSEQRKFVKEIIIFVVEEITTWVTEHGGWDEVLSDQSTSSQSHSSPIVTRPHSHSTPILPPVFSPTSTTSTPSQGEDFDRSNWRSQSFSVSRSIPMRPRVLRLSEPSSAPSSPRQRSLSGSLMTISVTAFGLALMSYLQS